ncbi:hypothetical protein M433DRAFT_152341 [Acidomyces richmondensis BFW]|nr:MAG: hypothetical protein FE78DRAFT_87305 [Acidomyces sp. 'richmondensis']KYG47339.1 hypothetical protein M433DRAFT_152341 [Acidomyces richmondensis BFW]
MTPAGEPWSSHLWNVPAMAFALSQALLVTHRVMTARKRQRTGMPAQAGKDGLAGVTYGCNGK